MGWLLLALWACAGLAAQADPAPRPASDVQTVVIPLAGRLDVTAAALVRRGFAAAHAQGAARVILDIDTTDAGELDLRPIEPIVAMIRAESMHTTAYVRQQALNAGAYVALACKEMFVSPAAKFGRIAPAIAEPMVGGSLDLRSDAELAAAAEALRRDVRRLAEGRGGLDKNALKAVEAMVDPHLRLARVTYRDNSGLTTTELLTADEARALEASGQKIEVRQEIGSRPLELDAEQCVRMGFAKGKAASLEELIRDEYLTTMKSTLVLEANWSESAVAWLDAVKPLLFIIGFVLLMAELKTPGVGVPGLLGAGLLGLAMFGSYLTGLADLTEILLLFLGLASLAVEIFFLPGSVVFALLGVFCVLTAMILSQQSFVIPSTEAETDILTGNLFNLVLMTIGVIVGFGLYVKFLPRIPLLNRLLLPLPPAAEPAVVARGAAGATSATELVGRVGTAATDLRPSGIVQFPDGSRYDAVTRGDFVEAGTEVKVLELAYFRVVVEPSRTDQRGQVAISWLLLLLVAGLLLIVAEVFFVTFGVCGGMAILSLVAAVVLAFMHHGEFWGFLFLTVAGIGGPAVGVFALRILPRTRFGQQIFLRAPTRDEVAVDDSPLRALIGKDGVAETVLRPGGIARIDGQRVDVVTRGELLEAGTPVRVLAVDSRRIVVGPPVPVSHSSP